MKSLAPRPSLSLLTKLLVPTPAAGLLVAVAVSSGRRPPQPSAGRAEAMPTASQAREAYGRIPLSFEANQGQAEGSFDFLARGAGYALFLRPTEAVFALRISDSGLRNDAHNDSDTHLAPTPQSAILNPQSKVLRMRLEGANVSGAFFLSIEFQQTGYLVFRFYKETFTDSPARPRGMPRYREFLRDTREIGRGVIVNQGNWQQQLEDNKQEFARQWVQRSEFVAQFPLTMGAEAFVDKPFQNAEVTPTQAERAAIAAFGSGGTEGRAAALRNVADSGSVYNRQYNAGFVLSQYIGYLRRNPNDAPEPNLDYAGFAHWLTKLKDFSLPGEDVRQESVAFARVTRSEMVKAFISSTEYRQRFGQ